MQYIFKINSHSDYEMDFFIDKKRTESLFSYLGKDGQTSS